MWKEVAKKEEEQIGVIVKRAGIILVKEKKGGKSGNGCKEWIKRHR